MKELEDLKQSIIDTLLSSGDLDAVYLIIRGNPSRKYSRRQLAEEVANNTPDGLDMVLSVVNLATDLIIREKAIMKKHKEFKVDGADEWDAGV